MKTPKNRGDEKQRALEQEIATHLEMSARDREDRGASAEQAAEAARREFGNVALIEHVTRDQWRGRWWDEMAQDVRFAVRTLRKMPVPKEVLAKTAVVDASNYQTYEIPAERRPCPTLDSVAAK